MSLNKNKEKEINKKEVKEELNKELNKEKIKIKEKKKKVEEKINSSKKTPSSFVVVRDVVKEYKVGDIVIKANNGISFKIKKGELVVILGQSGAGKSTLLNLIGGMENVTSGDIFIDGKEISKYTEKELIKYRREDIGFVFQFYNLVSNLTAKENVELASQIKKDAMDPEEALKLVNLEHRKDNFPAQLSGGEQQRVAIARAIAKKPKLLLCDEPTGALDYRTGKNILKVLKEISEKEDCLVIIITHNRQISKMADKVIEIGDAKVREITINENPLPVSQIKW